SGQTNNLEKRIKEHNSKSQRGAKYLRAKKPVKLIYFEEYPSLQLVMKREAEVKSWKKIKKETLVSKVNKLLKRTGD
ncbi:GIY-YIG nuclease family protein, partial [Candidatus Roizmanbacteria bacterium]|nr:GIY-YIG nuclease family protein [Candidatus Roizmanbacteria bacterium]